MKKLVLVLAALLAVGLAAVPGAVARPDGATADPGVTSQSITIGATLPLSGPASLYARIGTGMRAYFSYINARRARDGKRGRLRPADRPQGLRRPLPGGPDRPADPARGGAGPRLRDARRARHREPAGGPRVHEPAQGPAAVRLHRPQRVRPALPAEPRGRSAGSRTTSRRASSSGATSARTCRTRGSRCCGRTTTTAVNSSQGFQNAAGAGRVVATETYPRGGGAAVIAGPTARASAPRAPTRSSSSPRRRRRSRRSSSPTASAGGPTSSSTRSARPTRT